MITKIIKVKHLWPFYYDIEFESAVIRRSQDMTDFNFN